MDRDRGKLSLLIEKATHSTSRDLDLSLLKAVKSIVRSSESQVHVAVETLMENMKKNHSQVRYLALLIIDELFMRSKLFRSLLVVNFDQFLTLSVGFRRNMPLPPPSAIASTLRSKSIEFLEKWNNSFGFHYRQLRLGLDYLKNTLRFQFPNLQQTAARLQQERREREIRSQEILVSKFETLRDNYDSIKSEIQSTLDEIGECLDIISNQESKERFFNEYSEYEVEEFASLALRQIRLDSLKEGAAVHENNDNRVIFDALRELYKLLISKHLQSVRDWISVLVRIDLADNRFRDSALKEFIDIRNHVKSAKKRCEELGCALPEIGDKDDEVLWEEGTVEVEREENSLSVKSGKGFAKDATTDENNDETSEKGKKDLEGDDSGSTSLRQKLLAEAPVMTWGSFLDNWGSNRGMLANQRGLELDGHWGRVDYDAIIPAEKIAELNVQATLYKEPQLETRPCLTPLKKGGLCQRRDLRVCPFHGPIMPRDAEGNLIKQNPSPGNCERIGEDGQNDRSGGEDARSSRGKIERDPSVQETELGGEEPLDFEKEMAMELAKQAVKNVRSRDKEEVKRREQEAKRAKLAKVREHNDVVLRESALASTSQGLGEALGEDLESQNLTWPEYKEKKQTLAAMLRKKVTSRDRLARRLLNAQATDGTLRQLMQGDDVNYREAYPNQW